MTTKETFQLLMNGRRFFHYDLPSGLVGIQVCARRGLGAGGLLTVLSGSLKTNVCWETECN